MSKLSTVITAASATPDANLSEAEGTAVSAPASAAPEGAQRLRRRGRSLAQELVAELQGRIGAGLLKPGDKLPTESGIMRSFGVSRTVVREALSRLQAAAQVETRHGIGTFVLEPRSGTAGDGSLRLDPLEMATSMDVLAVLELRISLETESAGLAASRRSDAQLAAMRGALDDFARNVQDGGDTVASDIRFHLLVAQATGNRYFAEIMAHLGTAIIPRNRIASARQAAGQASGYLQKVNREHQEIFDAIARGDAESARAAMRVHLTNSRERLRQAQFQAALQAGQPIPD
jgi:DNA-binding FadR family transcriptional regulator